MAREMVRQGGRSARIQAEVHRAVRDLMETTDRDEVTVPMIAEQAGVTPSTIYRRWGDLSNLLADVAVAHMRPIAAPADTGARETDVDAFILQFAEEMSSHVGRQMLTDILSSGETPAKACGKFTYANLETLQARAVARGEDGFDVDDAVDFIVAPIIYSILFSDRGMNADYCSGLVARFFNR